MTTQIQFTDRDAVVASTPRTENPVNLREDEIANEKGIVELIAEIAQARRELKLSDKHLAALEESLAGKSKKLASAASSD
jgi:hypothetical protein